MSFVRRLCDETKTCHFLNHFHFICDSTLTLNCISYVKKLTCITETVLVSYDETDAVKLCFVDMITLERNKRDGSQLQQVHYFKGDHHKFHSNYIFISFPSKRFLKYLF